MFAGTPQIVAMREKIKDEAALLFNENFYGKLVQGVPVGDALTEARRGVRVNLPDTADWSIPIHISRVGAGPLISRDRSDPTTKVAPLIEMLEKRIEEDGGDLLPLSHFPPTTLAGVTDSGDQEVLVSYLRQSFIAFPTLALNVLQAVSEQNAFFDDSVLDAALRTLSSYLGEAPGMARVRLAQRTVDELLSSQQADRVATCVCRLLDDDMLAEIVAIMVECSAHLRPEVTQAMARASHRLPFSGRLDRSLRQPTTNKIISSHDDRTSLRANLSRHPSLRRSLETSPGWIRICLLLYGGLNPHLRDELEKVENQITAIHTEIRRSSGSSERKVILREMLERLEQRQERIISGQSIFDPEWFHRESPLTAYLLEALRIGQHPEGFAAYLQTGELEIGEETQPDPSLILLVTGNGQDLNKTIRASCLPRVESCLHFLLPLAKKVFPAVIKHLVGSKQEVHFLAVRAAMMTMRLCGGTPQSLLVAARTGPERFKIHFLARMWGYWLSGGPDSLLKLALILDSLEHDPLTQPVVLARSLAEINHITRELPTAVPGNPFFPTTNTLKDTICAVFEVLEGLFPHHAIFIVWVLARLAPLLNDIGMILESAILLVSRVHPETPGYISCLKQLSSYFDTVPNDDERSAWSLLVLHLTRKERDPYLHFRQILALTRSGFDSPGTISNGSGRLLQNKDSLLLSALNIVDPAQRTWALGQLYLHGLAEETRIWRHLENTTDAVSDHFTRGLLLAWLAIMGPVAQKERYLLESLWTLESTEKVFFALDLLAPYVSCFKSTRQRFAKLISQQDVLWQKWIQGDYASILAHCEKHRVEVSLPFCIFILTSRLATFSEPAVNQNHMFCEELEGSTAMELEVMLEQGDTERAVALLKGRIASQSLAFPALRRLADHDDTETGSLARLCLAESQGVHQQNMAHLLTFLDSPDDMIRLRAGALLKGSPGGTRELKVSRLGKQAIETLAESWNDRIEYAPQKALLYAWVFERILHDDQYVLGQWIRQCHIDNKRYADNRLILERIHHIDVSCWPVFIEGLFHGNQMVRDALLSSVVTLAARGYVDRVWPVLASGLRHIDTDRLSTLFPGNPKTLVNSIQHMMDVPESIRCDEQTLYEGLEIRIKQQHRLTNLKEGELLQFLCTSARRRLIDTNWYQPFNDAVAPFKDAVLFDILLIWLKKRLEIDAQNNGRDYITSDLVVLTSAAAETFPETFRECLSSHSWLVGGLIQVSRYSDWFPARCATFSLLAKTGQLNSKIGAAFEAAWNDVPLVQRAALASIEHYREAEPKFVHDLLVSPLHSSTFLTCASLRLLARCLKMDNLSGQLKQKILEAISTYVEDHRILWGIERIDDHPFPQYYVCGKGRLSEHIDELLIDMINETVHTT